MATAKDTSIEGQRTPGVRSKKPLVEPGPRKGGEPWIPQVCNRMAQQDLEKEPQGQLCYILLGLSYSDALGPLKRPKRPFGSF